MTLKTLAAAATLAVFATTGVNAATFDFYFDSSTATSGDLTLTAVGTLDINVAAGMAFTQDDISNVSIVVDSDLIAPKLLSRATATAGTLSGDGTTALFTSMEFAVAQLFGNTFGCAYSQCEFGTIAFDAFGATAFPSAARYPDPAAALASLMATSQVSPVPLPAGGLLLLSAFGGVAALKRRKKRAA